MDLRVRLICNCSVRRFLDLFEMIELAVKRKKNFFYLIELFFIDFYMFFFFFFGNK